MLRMWHGRSIMKKNKQFICDSCNCINPFDIKIEDKPKWCYNCLKVFK